MAYVFELKEISDARGSLCVLQDQIPFQIKRVFYIFGVPSSATRGGHRHKVTRMILICLNGSCTIHINDGKSRETIVLDHPKKCLLVEPKDFHYMVQFSPHATLVALASHEYDAADYVYEDYKND